VVEVTAVQERVASPSTEQVPRRRWPSLLLDVLIAATVGLLATTFVPAMHADTGPVVLNVSLRPALDGGVTFNAAPLGTAGADAYDAPERVVVSVGAIRKVVFEDALATLLDKPTSGELNENVFVPKAVDAIRGAVIRLVLSSLIVGGAAGFAVVLLLRHRPRRALLGAAAAMTTVAIAFGAAVVTYDEHAFDKLTATGALSTLPSLSPTELRETVGSDTQLMTQAAKFARNLTGLYAGFARFATSQNARDDADPVVVTLGDSTEAQTVATGLGAKQVVDANLQRFTSIGTISVIRDDSGKTPAVMVIGPGGKELARMQEKKVVDGSTPDGTGQLLVLYLDHSKLTLRAIDRVDISPDSVSVTRETVRSAG